jgi:hypothetical protein
MLGEEDTLDMVLALKLFLVQKKSKYKKSK